MRLLTGHPAVDEVMLDDGTRGAALEFAVGGQTVQLVIDPSSGLVLAERYVAQTADGEQRVEERFMDYRSIDGIMVPFSTTVRRNGRAVIERRLKSIAFNVTLPPETFEKRGSPFAF